MIGSIALTSAPTPGALLGTMGSQDLINNINSANTLSQYFGSNEDPYKTNYRYFTEQVIQPMREIGRQLKVVADRIFKKDEIRTISNISELENGIPPCMYDVFTLYQPINKWAIQGRVDAFGQCEEYLKEREDYWGRLINNGTVDLTREIKNNKYTVTWIEESSDPKWTIEQLEAICETRKFIDEFYENEKTKNFDITDYPSERG